MNKTAYVILPIGISGSGKSTWSKSLGLNYNIVSLDDMRKEFTGSINDKSKDDLIYVEAVNRMLLLLEQNKKVIIDSTNLTKEKRMPFIQAVIDSFPTIPIYYKLLPLDPELAKKRINKDIELGVDRAIISNDTIDRHVAFYLQAIEDLKFENIIKYNE